jgi:prepilin-type processing-associated H-X9-DG protein
MVQNSFLDCPGIYYHLGYGIAFADGHSEIKSWTDRRLTTWPNGAPYTPTSSDVTWLQGRTSALK